MPTGPLAVRDYPRRVLLRSRLLLFLVCLVLGAQTVPAQSATAANPSPAPTTVPDILRDPPLIWSMSAEEKLRPHHIQFEGRLSYYDPVFNMLWLEKDGISTYVQLRPPYSTEIHSGQQIRIDGTLIPLEGLRASDATFTVLAENVPFTPLDTKGRIGDTEAFRMHMVTIEGFVDEQLYIDPTHERLLLIVGDRPVVCWVRPNDHKKFPKLEGSFIRAVGLYSSRFDPSQTISFIEVWVSHESDVQVLNTLENSPRLRDPISPISTLHSLPVGTEIHVRGQARSQSPGKSISVRDDTGEVTVYSLQRKRVAVGDQVDVVGRLEIIGSQYVLRSALFLPSTFQPVNSTGVPAVLGTVEAIRQLSPEEAAKGHHVSVAGTVTWSIPDYDFFFLQDLTGGIRVRLPKSIPPPPLTKYLTVDGTTLKGGFSPEILLEREIEHDAMNAPVPTPITYDQAISGGAESQWVSMRGFIQRTVSDHDWRWIYVTTPTGDFVGHLNSPVEFVANTGSLIEIHGVCETNTDRNGHIIGVTLRVPYLHDITIEEEAPRDPFEVPLRSIKHLRQLSLANNFIRSRVAGVVQYSLPGKFVYLDDGDSGLLVLTHETNQLVPGTRVEAVGILGTQGARTVLREATFRVAGSSPAPLPIAVGDAARLQGDLDGRLVHVRGLLIDSFLGRDETKLTLQQGNVVFQAILESKANGANPLEFVPGTGLDLTGIYQINYDDLRSSHGFQVQLRNPQDIAIYQRPRMVTLERALIALGVVSVLSLAGIAWVTALRRRVKRQTEQIRAQLERQAELEVEVQRAARIESLGVLAGGIAHDFNNLLTIVLGNLTLAMLDNRVMEIAGDCLRDIEKGAIQAKDLTQQLLTFSRGGNPVRSNVSLQRIVRDNTDFILRGSNVRCDYLIDLNLWSALVDKDQIAQAVQNLVLNAVQAMPNGGILRVSLSNENVAEKAKPGLAAGKYVRLAINDSGVGIKPEILPKIFDPYFSTKSTGSGLGLATVYSIVKKHQGLIEVESTPGQGATFILWLPATEIQPEAEPMPSNPVNAASLTVRKSARILLMDDEESIRRLGAALLRRMGLEPTVVADGGEAVGEFVKARDAGRPFQLLILDLTIPGGMGGREAIELIRKLDTEVPAIVSSGYSNDPVVADFRSFGFNAIVSKPYEVSQMAAAIKRLLGDNS